MVVELQEDVPEGLDLVLLIDLVGLDHVSETAPCFRRNDAGQGRGDPVGGDDVISRDVLDFFQLVLRRKIPHRNNLNILLPAVGQVQEEVPEVAYLLGVLHGASDGVPLFVGQVGG